uniref:NADH-ubiquinone oxidoreductase chain 2 n=1 Tax=Derotettix mendosensis TaxID=2219932 RepID=A0A3S7MGG8_9HEMI|nr:NADH dehydrogenase subunit 2 [Derotettix mendosensis]
MKINSSYMMFTLFLILGVVICVSSNNWLGCWMGVEINMISFLPIVYNSKNMVSSESLIKYFIVQSMGSGILLFSVMFNMINFSFVIYMTMIGLLIKIGCPPFHMWFPSVMEGLSWVGCIILMSLQKLAPLVMISYLNFSMLLFIILSAIWGAMGGISYSSLRKVLSYSSIYNLSWLLTGIMINSYSWYFYFVMYIMMVTMFSLCLNMLNINYINQLMCNNMELYENTLLFFLLISLGGLPPFMGFMPKLILINQMMEFEMYFICFILVITALFVLYYYIRLVFTCLMFNKVFVNYYMFNMRFLIFLFGLVSFMGFPMLGIIILMV